jgi:hypothetical protein
LFGAGVDPASVSLESLIDPVTSAASAAMEGPLRSALAGSIASLFLIAFAAAFLGLLVVLFTPRGKVNELSESR